MSRDAVLAGEPGAIDEAKTTGRDGVFREKCPDSAAAGFPRTADVVALRRFKSPPKDFAQRFGEKVLAVFIKTKEQVLHRSFVNRDEFSRREKRRIERIRSSRRPADLHAARGEVRSHRIDKKCPRIDDGFAF